MGLLGRHGGGRDARVLQHGARASSLIGGSDLLDAGSLQQLSGWLGQGDLQLTNIFDKVPGQTAADFHAAADGKGATFTLIEAMTNSGTFIIGGYNPVSWSTAGAWTTSPNVADRIAFVFNLTTAQTFAQNATAFGLNGGYNAANAGPGFGNGFDIFVDGILGQASSFLASFGSPADFGKDLARYPAPQFGSYPVGRLKVFSIELAPVTTPVPEPKRTPLLLAGLAFTGAAARRRRRQR